MRLVPIREHKWSQDYTYLRNVTCKNHPSARYLTKNPYDRTLHLITYPTGLTPDERDTNGECKCPFSDLVVIVADDGRDHLTEVELGGQGWWGDVFGPTDADECPWCHQYFQSWNGDDPLKRHMENCESKPEGEEA